MLCLSLIKIPKCQQRLYACSDIPTWWLVMFRYESESVNFYACGEVSVCPHAGVDNNVAGQEKLCAADCTVMHLSALLSTARVLSA